MSDDIKKLEEFESQEKEQLREKLNLETARIAWADLQTFFASGSVIEVSAELDLIDIAQAIANDHSDIIAQFIQENKIAAPSDESAKKWYAEDKVLWAVVVRPWVLIQDRD